MTSQLTVLDFVGGYAASKVDRVVELAEKLDGVAEEASGETVDHIRTARNHCLEYVEEDGGDEQPRTE
ncbi:hypothetical protein [Haloterrigena salifodinae]|uniref:hypothetical protein n=1 Tax=Haloterrigena salifodinae TaxID=2675099 RepID=UPI000F880906|nr:hypothetical protein [Haloterrigena salifodinae]